ncbi:MAG: DUF4041 domain-containing protein [Flavobacteriales bacterium]
MDTATSRLAQLSEKYKKGLESYEQLTAEVTLYQNTLELHESGIYQPQFTFDTSEEYKVKLEENYARQKEAVKNDLAVTCKTQWQVHGSQAEGKKMTDRFKKLMLFAFNGECDGLIAKVRWNNAQKARERIKKSFDTINKLGSSHQTAIEVNFLLLKQEELSLTHEYEAKKHEEKEEQRRIREAMREEEKAQRELERAQRDAEEEEKRYEKALEKAKQQLGGASADEVKDLQEKIAALEQKLRLAQEQKQRAISMAQQTKVGHIYVISNIGSLGEEVYKLGMTRRLEPKDRIKELGDASVPFEFDIHAIIFSENAPQLEAELHRKFSDRRVNRINHRKEFFRVSLDEIADVVRQHTNAEIQFTALAEAREFRETMALLEKLKQESVMVPPVKEKAFPTDIL